MKNVLLIVASLLIGAILGGLSGYSSGKCDGINWLAREHSIPAQCK